MPGSQPGDRGSNPRGGTYRWTRIYVNLKTICMNVLTIVDEYIIQDESTCKNSIDGIFLGDYTVLRVIFLWQQRRPTPCCTALRLHPYTVR